MNETDGQNTEFTDDEEVLITDLDTPDAPQHKRARQIMDLTRSSWIRLTLFGVLILLLSGVFFHWPWSAPMLPGMASVPVSHALRAVNTPELVFIQDSNNTLIAFQATTGRALWHFNLPAAATLKVLDQTLYSYFVTAPGKTELEALNMNTGQVIWHDALPAAFTNGSDATTRTQTPPPLFSGDNALYVRSNSNRIYALAAGTGRTMWTYQTDTPPVLSTGLLVQHGALAFLDAQFSVHILNASTGQEMVDPPGRSEALPTIDGQLIYVLSSPIRVFHIPDGRQLWTYTLPGDAQIPTERGGIVYIGAEDGKMLIALRGSDGHQLWTYQASDGQPLANIDFSAHGLDYLFQQDATLVSLRAGDGSILWRIHLSALQQQSNLITQTFLDKGTTLLFGFDLSSNASVPQPTSVYALRSSDGQLLWSKTLSLASYLPFAGTLYVLQETGELDAWRESNGEYLWSSSTLADTGIIGDFSPGSHARLLLLLGGEGVFSVLRPSDGKQLWRYP